MPILGHGESEAEHRVLRALRLAVATSLALFALEAGGAYISHSLSLTVDAVHNLPDILAFAVSYLALEGTSRGSSANFSFGRHRVEVFAGLFNGALVLAAGLLFGYEAAVSLGLHATFDGTVDAPWLFAVAIPVLGFRIFNLQLLGKFPARIRDLNLRSVVVHLTSDIAITVGLLVAGALLIFSGNLLWVDPLVALAIAAILVAEAIPLLREGWEVLTDRVPRGLSLNEIKESALAVPGVVEVHDLHVWAVCSTLVCLTAHVGVKEMTLHESMNVVEELRGRIEHDFGILHATFEVECGLGHSHRIRNPTGGADS